MCTFRVVIKLSHTVFIHYFIRRINKKGSQKDAEQKKSGNYFFMADDEDDNDDFDDI